MLDLRVIAGGRTMTPFDLPALLGRDGAAREIADTVEALIAFLDDLGGDPDLEDGDEDCCEAHDDAGGTRPASLIRDGMPGDPDDAEDDDPTEPNGDEQDEDRI